MRPSANESPGRGTSAEADPADAHLDQLYWTLEYARARQYAGYDYADGLSSPLRSLIPGESRWVNLALQETAKRAPVNIRPLLGVPRRRSFKGCALFATAEHRLAQLTQDDEARHRRDHLLGWLWRQRSTDPFGWGHNHDIQKLDGRVDRNTPNIVTGTFVARAVLEIGDEAPTPFIDAIETDLPQFIESDLVVETADGPRLRYRPTADADSFVLNANALGGITLVELAEATDTPRLYTLGESVLDYVVDQQHHSGGWRYTDPAGASHLSMDNHHNGFIVESLLRHARVTGSSRYDDAIDDGLAFYRSTLFDATGAPRWDETSTYPRDIHAAAQGIVTFVEAGDLEFAARIIDWTTSTLSDGAGAFHFRQEALYTKRYTLMRWCQAWMAVALSSYCQALTDGGVWTD